MKSEDIGIELTLARIQILAEGARLDRGFELRKEFEAIKPKLRALIDEHAQAIPLLEKIGLKVMPNGGHYTRSIEAIEVILLERLHAIRDRDEAQLAVSRTREKLGAASEEAAYEPLLGAAYRVVKERDEARVAISDAAHALGAAEDSGTLLDAAHRIVKERDAAERCDAERALVRIQLLIAAGDGDSAIADELRDEFEALKRELRPSNLQLLDELAGDLDSLSNREIADGTPVENAEERLQAALQNQELSEFMTLARAAPDVMPEWRKALWRGRGWSMAGFHYAAAAFAQRAVELNPALPAASFEALPRLSLRAASWVRRVGAAHRAIKERDEAVKERDEAVKERDEAVKERDEAVKERDEAKTATLHARTAHGGAANEFLKERDEAVKERAEAEAIATKVIKERDEAEVTVGKVREELNVADGQSCEEAARRLSKEWHDMAHEMKRLRCQLDAAMSPTFHFAPQLVQATLWWRAVPEHIRIQVFEILRVALAEAEDTFKARRDDNTVPRIMNEHASRVIQALSSMRLVAIALVDPGTLP